MAEIHPPADVLRGFAAGRLDQRTTAALEAHLADCAACWAVVEAAENEHSLLGQLRSLPPDLVPHSGPVAVRVPAPMETVPAELAAHPNTNKSSTTRPMTSGNSASQPPRGSDMEADDLLAVFITRAATARAPDTATRAPSVR